MALAKAFLKELTFSDGQSVPIAESDIIVIVGGNNSGKSTALKNIAACMRDARSVTKHVITNVELAFSGETEDFLNYLRNTATEQDNSFRFGTRYSWLKTEIVKAWENKSNIRANAEWLFLNLLSTDTRLNSANATHSFDAAQVPPDTPIQMLFLDDAQEKHISNLFKQAFGLNLVLDKIAGNIIPIYVSDDTVLPYNVNRTETSFANKLRKFPRIDEEGDGMRSFVGILLNAVVGQKSITLIDEPEAFLHPPQARLLAKTLVTETSTDKQLIISTHSQDIVNGMLDSDTVGRVKIIRLERDGNINKVSQLEPRDVKQLWADPLLRYSNILSGLFHEHVVLCEADTDCKFYQTISDSLFDGTNIRRPDILFTHCGGKDRMKNVIKALQAVKVQLSVICDLDVINNEETIKGIVEAKGANWDDFRTDWNIVYQAILRTHPEIEKAELAQKLTEQLNAIEYDFLTATDMDGLRKTIRKTSPWEAVKSGGKNAIPAGDATAHYNVLNKKLEDIGVFLVPVGELECFDKTIGGHGVKWLTEVLRRPIADDNLIEAKKFVKTIYTKAGIEV